MRRKRLYSKPAKNCRSDKIRVAYMRWTGGRRAVSSGMLQVGQSFMKCQLGRNGMAHRKREGDQKTPRGRFRILFGFFRRDRVKRPSCQIPLGALKPTDIWSDDPTDFSYNRLRRAPARFRHENLWMEEQQYDLVFVLSHNIKPRVLGRGSAIFLHILGKTDHTSGCIALSPAAMRKTIQRLSARASLVI